MAGGEGTTALPIEAIYVEHHGWLRAWLCRRLGCEWTASDLAQDTFVRVLSGRRPADWREPRAFLTTVAHGLMVDHLRRRDLERAILDALAVLPEPLEPSPETRALWLETLLEIDTMLRGLAPRVRQAFLLAQLEGQTYAQIAQRLGCSTASVKLYLRQALVHCALCVA